MKKRLKLFSLLAVIVASMFTFVSATMFSSVKATYIEGNIIQDTIWTLVDSPFVVSKDIYVFPNATLTIEPGVEVRFGGKNFTFTVGGTLNAVGTQNRSITFTSNRVEPAAGDWQTINITGSAQSSLTHCVLEYAATGLTIANSTVQVKNSQILNCSQHGIFAVNSTLSIWDNEIHDNQEDGIFLADENTATIQGNVISANKDGIFLSGVSTQSVNITQNQVQQNGYSGININVTDYSKILILNNIVSANVQGFYVSALTSTLITNNSISFNDVGIFYATGAHAAHWNDIYNNTIGVDIAYDPEIDIDAEYNYWGHESGPYHEWLNPFGKGDEIQADGKNLDFIFWLSAPIGYINQRPVVRLLSDKVLVAPNQKVMFFATTSSDDRRVDKYFFDFGDGANSRWTTLTIFEHKYSSAGTYQASLRVMDDFAVTSTNTATINMVVQVLTPLEVSLTLSRPDIYSEGPVTVTARAKTGATPMANANVTLFSIVGGSFSPKSGLTNSTGYVTTTFTAPNITEVTEVRIVARASKSSYADGSDYKYLQVLPRLNVEVRADPSVAKSEGTAYALVHVTSNTNPIPDAFVSVSATNGSFSESTGYSDQNGDVAFNFTAPKTTTQINVTITASATKTRYFENQSQISVTINPRTLTVQITGPVVLESKATSQIIILVTDDATPIAEASVTIASNLGGTFSATSGVTDQNGNCFFDFTAPEVTTEVDTTIMVSAAKTGYWDGEKQTIITITPLPSAAAGIPWLTILLILIPVIAVAVIVVLIKTKRLVISRQQLED
jgi:parallel beta-helix repeat protein